MIVSVSSAFEKKRKELIRLGLNKSLTSSETIHLSQQLDYFVNHYQTKKLSKLDISHHIDGLTLKLNIRGQLDFVSSEQLLSHLLKNKSIFNRIKKLSINLSGLNFFDTSGIETIIALVKEAKRNNISVQPIITSKTSFEVLKMMGITNALEKDDYGTFVIENDVTVST